MSELSQEARLLIEGTAHADAPTLDDRERLKKRLSLELGAAAFATATVCVATTATAVSSGAMGASSSLATSGAGASTIASSAGILGGVGKLAIAVSLVGAVGTTAIVTLAPRENGQPSPSAVHAIEQPAPASPPAQAVPAQPLPTPVVEQLHEPPATAEALRAKPVARAPRGNQPAAARVEPAQAAAEPVRASDLAGELDLLARAQTALRAGNASDALKSVREHAARFPDGTMREERLGIEALAQCALGAGGEQVVRDFLRAAPASPLAPRVRDACGVK